MKSLVNLKAIKFFAKPPIKNLEKEKKGFAGDFATSAGNNLFESTIH